MGQLEGTVALVAETAGGIGRAIAEPRGDFMTGDVMLVDAGRLLG